MRRIYRNPIDSHHEQTRAILTTISIVLLVIGIGCLIVGGGLFVSNFFTHSSSKDFFSKPEATMDLERSRAETAFLGMVLSIIGIFIIGISVGILRFALIGKILRYQAGEIIPVAKDVARDIAPAAGGLVREISSAIRKEVSSPPKSSKILHRCGTENDIDDRFCKGCGAPLRLDCPSCNKPNDFDANFCDWCGTQLK